MNRFICGIATASLLGGCSTTEQSTLLGATTEGALGLAIGIAVERSTGSALIGLGSGTLFGAGLGFAAHRDKSA